MSPVPTRFAHNDIMTLTSQPVRYDLAESVGPDLTLGSVLDDGFRDELDHLSLAYGTAPGNAVLRELIGAHHGVSADDVVTTNGAMQALFLHGAIRRHHVEWRQADSTSRPDVAASGAAPTQPA